jgi:transposase InsO family protein
MTGDHRNASDGASWDFVHVAIDDATRLAYVEVLADERRATTTDFLVRALRWFRALGLRVRRVISDNGSPYVSKLFRKACRWLGIRHIRTRAYTPKTNGKAERFIQTLMRQWAYASPSKAPTPGLEICPGGLTDTIAPGLTQLLAADRPSSLSARNNVLRSHN